ncbi:ABC-three component system middle component 2 [Kitasatospora sp. NPDC088783]|uniref:ABC-three component system middle component 2 n=1 Tax=Kitasatospora sp. NPDC088783 TaxID=3364077 RepID=UPI00381FAC47
MNVLNGPVEVGMRALALLAEAHPEALDLAALVVLDHAVLHSGRFGGPPSLLPELPAQPGELGRKRELLHEGLTVLMRAGLASIDATAEGLVYRATARGSSFLRIFEAPYVGRLCERATWAVERLAPHADPLASTRAITQTWREQFAASAHHPGDGHE